jgi:hypothetical protein
MSRWKCLMIYCIDAPHRIVTIFLCRNALSYSVLNGLNIYGMVPTYVTFQEKQLLGKHHLLGGL